jgi:tripartite-type tricarboxylate transporter receptor subunit TctC
LHRPLEASTMAEHSVTRRAQLLSMLRDLACRCSLALMMLAPGAAYPQSYPTKPLRLITQAPGGGSDYAARIIAPAISVALGQPVLVENRSGNVAVPAELVAKAPADGYTVLYVGSGLWVAPLLQKTSYDPVTDFTPITLATSSPTLLVVHPSLPVKSVRELIALAKARPDALNYASGGVGGAGHLAMELFNSMAGVKTVHVPYKSGGGAGLTDLLSGQIQITINNGPSLMPHVNAGRLRALAVTSIRPSALFPGLPAVAAVLPGYESAQMNAVLAPPRTPDTIVARLNSEIVRFLKTPQARERFFNSGTEIVAGSPADLAATMQTDMGRWSKVIREAGIKGD